MCKIRVSQANSCQDYFYAYFQASGPKKAEWHEVGDRSLQERPQAMVDILLQLLSELGFTVNWAKFCPLSQSVIFLGIKINSVTGTIRIPEAKMAVLTDCLDQFCLKKKATKRELQVLLGKLAWGAKYAKALRPTFQSLIKLQSYLQKPSDVFPGISNKTCIISVLGVSYSMA